MFSEICPIKDNVFVIQVLFNLPLQISKDNNLCASDVWDIWTTKSNLDMNNNVKQSLGTIHLNTFYSQIQTCIFVQLKHKPNQCMFNQLQINYQLINKVSIQD